jgi:AraC-like DNA-binding protein
MFNGKHLSLRLNRVASPAEWVPGRDELWFFLPTHGAGEFSLGHVRQPVEARDLVILRPQEAVRLTPRNGENLVLQEFSIGLEHLFPLFAANEIPSLRRVFDGLRGARHYSATTQVARACHKVMRDVPPEQGLDQRSQLLRIAALVLAAESARSQTAPVGPVLVQDKMRQMLEGLSAEHLLRLTVKELAGQLGCSRRHLNRLFHRYYGSSVADVRMELRLAKAVTLLRDPDAKVASVASECGFHCPNVFNICFKRRFGTSPGERRRLLLQEATLPPQEMHAPPSPDCLLHAAGVCPWISNGRKGNGGNGKKASPARDRGLKVLISIKRLQSGEELPRRTARNSSRTVLRNQFTPAAIKPQNGRAPEAISTGSLAAAGANSRAHPAIPPGSVRTGLKEN